MFGSKDIANILVAVIVFHVGLLCVVKTELRRLEISDPNRVDGPRMEKCMVATALAIMSWIVTIILVKVTRRKPNLFLLIECLITVLIVVTTTEKYELSKSLTLAYGLIGSSMLIGVLCMVWYLVALASCLLESIPVPCAEHPRTPERVPDVLPAAPKRRKRMPPVYLKDYGK